MNSKKKSVLSLVLVSLLAAGFSGCATKSNVSPEANQKDECGEGTATEGGIAGAVIGGIFGAVTGGNKKAMALGGAIGGALGAVGGYLLSEMQCKYHGQERELIKQINTSKENQKNLLKDSEALNQKISQLSDEMETLEAKEKLTQTKKSELLASIKSQKENLVALQKENDTSKKVTQKYSDNVKAYQYKESDREKLTESLKELHNEQATIQTACATQLKTLNELEQRITL